MYIITGATGHIGNNLTRIMLAAGEPVKILLRRKGEAVEGLAVEMAFGNVFDSDFLASHVGPGDVLIHLAALIDLSNKRTFDSLSINYQGAKTIADFCVAHDVRLIFISSVDAINKPAGHGKITEPNGFEPDRLKNVYARSKALATAYVHRLQAEGKLQGCILYPAAVIGVNDFKPSAAGREIRRALRMRLAFYIRGGYNFIDVRDTARAIYAAAKKAVDGDYILAAHNVTIRDFYRAIAKANTARMLVVRVPVAVARLGGLFMKGFSNVMIDALCEHYDYDNARMRRDLLPEPMPFERTLADTIAWFQSRET
ncbi:MAG: NAD-dependent epimerase/dehydratase family protein [bacterium]